jgi:hypothetical protein
MRTSVTSNFKPGDCLATCVTPVAAEHRFGEPRMARRMNDAGVAGDTADRPLAAVSIYGHIQSSTYIT